MPPTQSTGGDISVIKIPIIDLAPVSGPWDQVPLDKLRDLAHQIGEAFSQVGFAYVINHGVDHRKVNKIHDKAFQFFQLPSQVKAKYRKANPVECFHGYAGPGEERLNEKEKNSTELREFFDIWGPLQHQEEAFPSEAPGLKSLIDQVRPECHNLVRKLFKAASIFLNFEDVDFFVKRHTLMDQPEPELKAVPQSQFRVLHYYPMEPADPSIPRNAIRCGEHADWGTLTLLFQDQVGGLEVLNNKDGKWMEATPLEGSILVNVAQLLQLWSGGIFKAAVHRVRIINEERVRTKSRKSFVYFINPDGDVVVKCLIPVPPGLKEFAEMSPKVAYDHIKHLIQDATSNY